MTAEVKAFPNVSTQFRGGERLGKPRPLVGKRKARKLKAVVAVAEALRGPMPTFTGDGLQLLQSVYRDETLPLETRMAAANAATRFERPSLAAAPPPRQDFDLAERLQMARLSAAERRARIADLASQVMPALEGTAAEVSSSDPSGEGSEPATHKSTSDAESVPDPGTENRQLKLAIAELESRRR